MKPYPWHYAPALRAGIPLVAGLLLGRYLALKDWGNSSTFKWLLFGLIGIYGLAYLFIRLKGRIYKARTLRGILLLSMFTILGAGLSYDFYAPPLAIPQSGTYLARIDELPVRSPKGWRTSVELLENIKTGDIAPNLLKSERAQIFLASDRGESPNYGDILYLRGDIKPAEGPIDPYVFNYRDYLSHNGIQLSGYFPQERWKLSGDNRGSILYRIAYRLRQVILSQIAKIPSTQDNIALMSALLVGDTHELSKDLKRSYANTGVLHILSVSGFHVAILYIVLSALLMPLKGRPFWGPMMWIILAITPWMYALVCGLTPAVCRAALMLSIVVVGGASFRNSNGFQSLCLVAILIVLARPGWLWQAGFGLSFAGTFGLIWIAGKVQDLWHPKNGIVKWTWALVCACIAAQVATLPLGAYYFRTFPTYFLPANLLLIPLSLALFYLGWVYVIIASIGSFVSPLWEFLGTCLSWLLEVNTLLVNLISSAPWALPRLPYFNPWQAAILALMLALFIRTFLWKRLHSGIVAACLGLVLLASHRIRQGEAKEHPMLIVHAIPKGMGVSIRKEDSLLVCLSGIHSNTSSPESFTLEEYIYPYAQAQGISLSKVITINEPLMSDLLKFQGFLWHSGLNPNASLSSNERIRAILVNRDNNHDQVTSMITDLQPQVVILSRSIHYKTKQAWLETGVQHGIKVIDLEQEPVNVAFPTLGYSQPLTLAP